MPRKLHYAFHGLAFKYNFCKISVTYQILRLINIMYLFFSDRNKEDFGYFAVFVFFYGRFLESVFICLFNFN